MGKKERHAAIMELIQQKELETQEDLIQALLEQGISATQATISRDIRELQLVKQHLENGVCCYRLPEQTPISDHSANGLCRTNCRFTLSFWYRTGNLCGCRCQARPSHCGNDCRR